jgi:hypothetical protein
VPVSESTQQDFAIGFYRRYCRPNVTAAGRQTEAGDNHTQHAAAAVLTHEAHPRPATS